MLDYGYVTADGTLPDLSEIADASVLSFDTETSGVNVAKDIPWGFSLASAPNSAYYTYMNNRFFADLLADEQTLKVAHNAKFDRSMFKKFGITVNNLCDTMIAAHLLEENRLSLEVLLKRFIKGYDLDIHFFKDFDKPIPHATLQEMANHFGAHSAAALALWNVLQRELRSNNLWNVFWNIEMPVVPVLSDMELDGAMIDTKALSELGEYYDERTLALDEAMYHFAGRRGINFNSADQAADILYEQFKVPKPPQHMKKLWTEKGRPTVDKTYLEQFKGIKFPIVNVYLMYKMYRHLKDTYVDGIMERLVDGRIHTNFNQTRTRTGRLSSTDPNLQNIPMRTSEGRKIRKSFIAPEGKKIVKADMDQVEMRKMACLSNCKALLDAFREGRD
ncbi:DNA polymerase, partial [Candidatus Bathyarchaeota archaeon]|nr:DNA polymerase [Candidatus Bathyarchaeota archaeon]